MAADHGDGVLLSDRGARRVIKLVWHVGAIAFVQAGSVEDLDAILEAEVFCLDTNLWAWVSLVILSESEASSLPLGVEVVFFFKVLELH